MNTNSSESSTYQIKKINFSKSFIVIPILIIIIGIFIFFFNKPTPKSTVLSFIDTLQDCNYDKLLTYIDFDSMVAFSTINGDINNFNSALEHLNNMSNSEKEITTETISYTKRYIQATIDEIRKDNVIFHVNDIEVFNVENNDNLNKVTVKLLIEKNNDTKNENMTFYTMKKDKDYHIIDFNGEIYF